MDTALRVEVDRLLGEGPVEALDFEAIETAGRRTRTVVTALGPLALTRALAADEHGVVEPDAAPAGTLYLGLCMTTGGVEGGCKHVVATRFKRSGMHWTVNGANAVMALRRAILNNRFDDFRERRAGVK